MSLLQILLLALVQGAAELLPVSSSAHVIVAEKLMGIRAASPEATFLLVMLHTGTMLAVILYFWKSWKKAYFPSREAVWRNGKLLALATLCTGIVGYALKIAIEKALLRDHAKAEIEMIFDNLSLMSASLAVGGLLILIAGWRKTRDASREREINLPDASWIGLVQGLCLPFRGFSRSGATISTALLRRVARMRAEEFSFALAVILTPPVVLRELNRLQASRAATAGNFSLMTMLLPGIFGMTCAFVAGLLALQLISRWLEAGKWYFFGIYCLVASGVVLSLHLFCGI